MKKKVNSIVKVMRFFINKETGGKELRPTLKDVAFCNKSEQAWCPECDEEVTLHLDSRPQHYEHKTRAGKPCSFKTQP